MNVFHFPTRYFPAISGAEYYIQRISEVLNKKYDVKVDIFCSDALDFSALKKIEGKNVYSRNKFYQEVNGLKIKRFSIKYDLDTNEQLNLIGKNKYFEDLNLSLEILKEFVQNGPNICEALNYCKNGIKKRYDLIHTTYIPYLNIPLSLILGKMWKIPTICTPFFHFENPRYQNPHYIEILNKFDLIFCCTNSEKNYLTNCGIKPGKMEVIPMGIDLEKYEKSKTINFKKQFFGEQKVDYPMILFCGYKNFEKGALSLLKSIPSILEKNRDILFTFIGPSTTAYNIELDKIKKQHNFNNIVNLSPSNLSGYFDKRKLSAFRECEVFAMPSRSDAFGIAFLEAWAYKKPVIGANIGSTPEVISDGKDGLLVEFNNNEDISNKILFLLDNKHYAASLGAAGYEKLKSKSYFWEKITKKIFITYQNLIKINTNK